MSKMFASDSKNYHVWSYRVWLVRRFNLWDTEIPYVDALIEDDVRNNSAWSHRFFVLFQRDGKDPKTIDLEDELSYVQEKIALAPQNASPWNYLRGVLKAAGKPITTIKALCVRFAPINAPELVKSSHALDILASIYAAEEDRANAKIALQLLSEKFDPIRNGYWKWRASLLERRSITREATIRPEGESTIIAPKQFMV